MKGCHLGTILAGFGPIRASSVREGDFKNIFQIQSMFKLCQLPWLAGGVIGHISERGPHKDHSINDWSQVAM